MSEAEPAAREAEALARATRITGTFKIERRLEDEPAHHDRALERLADAETERER